MTISGVCRVVEDYADVRGFFCAGSSLRSVADAQHHFAEWSAEVDDPGDSGGYKDRGCPDRIPAIFRLLFEALVGSQTNIGEAVPPSPGGASSSA